MALWITGRPDTAASRSTNRRSCFIFPVAWVIWMKPSSRAASTSARHRMSSSHIVSVTIGVPSKSAWVELRPRRWIENPHNPASIPSSRTRCISLRSASVAGRLFAASRPIT